MIHRTVPVYPALRSRGPSVAAAAFLVLAMACSGAAKKSQPAPAASPTRASTDLGAPYSVDDWWPNRLDLSPLEHTASTNPMDDDFDYAAEFSELDLEAVKKDIEQVLTTSQEWWPAEYGQQL